MNSIEECKTIWHFCYRGNFMFLKPSLSEVSIIYTLPFSRTVWITYALIVATLTVALVFSMRTEQSLKPSEHDHPVRWSDAALNSIGIVCQQGILLLRVPPEYSILFVSAAIVHNTSVFSLVWQFKDCVTPLLLRKIVWNVHRSFYTWESIIRLIARKITNFMQTKSIG